MIKLTIKETKELERAVAKELEKKDPKQLPQDLVEILEDLGTENGNERKTADSKNS
jgi:hypothetical protein